MDSNSAFIPELAIANRLLSVRERIGEACDRASRDPSEITIIAVTKGFPKDTTCKACAAGFSHLGENRIQEALEKFEDGWINREFPNVKLHLIGHLQTNKVRKAVQLFHSIDSVDSNRLLHSIETCAEEAQVQPWILLEVNTSGESQKFGVSPDKARGLAEHAMECKHLRLSGLMTVGPNVDDIPAIRSSFRMLRDLFDKIRKELNPPHWTVLSMGMSHDFEIAIEEGATEVRLGTVLFGERS